MSTRKVAAKEWVCDGCGIRHVAAASDEPPPGIHGKGITHVHSGGASGSNKAWWACSEECITPAVMAMAAERSW